MILFSFINNLAHHKQKGNYEKMLDDHMTQVGANM